MQQKKEPKRQKSETDKAWIKQKKKAAAEKIQANRDKQRDRWWERRKERENKGVFLHVVKGTKKGAQKGCFGKCKGPFDPRPALKPDEMKRTPEQEKEAKRKRNILRRANRRRIQKQRRK